MGITHLPLKSAIGGIATAIIIGGCGSGAKHTTRTSGPSAQASVTVYISAVRRLEQPIEADGGDTLLKAAAADQLSAARTLQHAYATAAQRLSAMTPPTVGVTAQRQLLAAWSNAATRLGAVVNHQPFYYRHADSVAIAVGQRAYTAYGDVLTIP
jgi:hypothetical protein